MFQKVKTFFVPVMAFVTETIIPKIKSRKLFYAGAGVISSPILLNPLFWLAVTPVVIAIGVYLNFKVLHGKRIHVKWNANSRKHAYAIVMLVKPYMTMKITAILKINSKD